MKGRIAKLYDEGGTRKAVRRHSPRSQRGGIGAQVRFLTKNDFGLDPAAEPKTRTAQRALFSR